MSFQVLVKVSAMLLVASALLCFLLPPVADAHVLPRTNEGAMNDSDYPLLGGAEDDIANSANEINKFFNDTRSRFIDALKNLSTYLPINVNYVYAIKIDGACDIIHYNKTFYDRVPLIISAVLIVLGVIFCFFGYRLIKIVLFLIGFLIGFVIIYSLIAGLTYDRPEHWIPYVALASAAVIGLVTGLLTICIYYIGIFLAGGSIGFLITWFILASINIAFFREHLYVPIIIAVVVGVAVGILALILQKWLFILGTSILGAFLAVWGLDYYLELGSMIYYLFLFAEHRSDIKPCWYSWAILPVFGVLILAGLLIQAFVTGRKYNHKKEMRGVCCGLCSKKKSKDEKEASDGKGKYMKLKPVTEDKE